MKQELVEEFRFNINQLKITTFNSFIFLFFYVTHFKDKVYFSWNSVKQGFSQSSNVISKVVV